MAASQVLVRICLVVIQSFWPELSAHERDNEGLMSVGTMDCVRSSFGRDVVFDKGRVLVVFFWKMKLEPGQVRSDFGWTWRLLSVLSFG